MGLLDELLKAQKPKRNLMDTQMVKGPDQPYLRQDYPTLYGALGGLLGTAPDEMAGSVLDPNTAAVRQGAGYGFPVGTALGVLPMAVPAQRGAMALGRAGERLAERAVPQVMDRGGLLAEMMQGMSNRTVSPLDVYHGTPHTLPPTPRNPLGEFDASKIGTGEGAQSYGHGIYTAENPDVAKSYQFMEKNWFDTSKAKYKGKSIDSWYEQAQKDQDKAFRTNNKALEKDATARLAYWENIMTHNHPENVLKQFTDPNYGWDEAANYAKSIDLNKFSGVPRSGNLYKADLPDEKIAQMLDWDKPLYQQSENVQQALAKLGYVADKNKIGQFDDALLSALQGGSTDLPKQPLNLTGEAIYKKLGSPQSASEKLKQLGIPGIKYLDEGSRAAGVSKQTRNFVTFPGEEQNLRILERNSQKASDLLANPVDEEELRRLQSGLLYAP